MSKTEKDSKALAANAGSLLALGTLIAAEPSADASALRSFEMCLYKAGYVFAGHWQWGNIVLDLAGLNQHRQDVPALHNHYRSDVAGFTKTLGVFGSEISAAGMLLNGSKEDEPVAYMIRSRLEQNFPYQCSGRFEPELSAVETVPEGARVTVDGVEHVGPLTIFRKYKVAEVSFTELGWFNQSSAKLAAGENQNDEIHILESTKSPVPAALEGAKKPMTTENTPATEKKGLLSLMAEAFGHKEAIAMFEENPDASGIEAFAPKMIETITALRASVDTLTASVAERDTKITKLEADLAAAKANPPLTAAAGDPSIPAAKEPKLEGVEALKAEYQKSEALQAEFGSVENFLKFKENESHISIS